MFALSLAVGGNTVLDDRDAAAAAELSAHSRSSHASSHNDDEAPTTAAHPQRHTQTTDVKKREDV
jgi:hypothetical protein